MTEEEQRALLKRFVEINEIDDENPLEDEESIHYWKSQPYAQHYMINKKTGFVIPGSDTVQNLVSRHDKRTSNREEWFKTLPKNLDYQNFRDNYYGKMNEYKKGYPKEYIRSMYDKFDDKLDRDFSIKYGDISEAWKHYNKTIPNPNKKTS